MDTLTDLFTWATAAIDSLTQLVTDSPLTYLVIFALTAVDVLLPIVPAEATVTAAAVIAGQGNLNIVWVMVAAGLGAFVGDNIAYWIGRAAGRPVVRKVLRGNTERLDEVQRQFDRRGGVFIVVGRFVPGGRTAVAIGAGIVHFSWIQFLVYDAIAAVIWSFQAALPGFIGGSLIQERPWLALIFGFVLSGSIALGIALGQRWWDRRHRARDGERPGPDDDAVASRELKQRVVSRVTGIPTQLPGEDLTPGPDDPSEWSEQTPQIEPEPLDASVPEAD
jgi:membrane-associated protein